MKIAQKLVIIILLFSLGYSKDINKQYIDELLNYNIKLPSEIYNSFLVKKVSIKNVIKPKRPKIEKMPERKIVLLAVLNNKALVKITGINLEKWLKAGDKIDKYKLIKIIDNSAILVKKEKKTKIVSLNKNNFNIKVRK